MNRAFIIFHLNLAYSSVSEADRRRVIDCCYRPLLSLAESTDVPIGVELTGWTLQQIVTLAPEWVDDFRRLLDAGRCELVESGYAQVIGPLVPRAVNEWNLRLGGDCYERWLGRRAKVALVNELAFSSGLAAVYQEAGYGGLVIDHDNTRLAIGTSDPIACDTGGCLPVLWSDSVLFQKLQRYVHGDITLTEYIAYLERRFATSDRPLAIYCNDAEVFDFRPGRYRDEGRPHAAGEWDRLAGLLNSVTTRLCPTWLRPSEALPAPSVAPPQQLTSAVYPITVKKQAKYNIARWAVTGRNDLVLNTWCHRIYRQIQAEKPETAAWRTLCELWASDLRTHIGEARWEAGLAAVRKIAGNAELPLQSVPPTPSPGAGPVAAPFSAEWDVERIHLHVRTPSLHVIFNRRRGLALQSLAFARHGFTAIAGTLTQGHFESIELGADYYSGVLVVELPGEHRRITDLDHTEPHLWEEGGQLYVQGTIPSDLGPITKTWVLSADAETLELQVAFVGWKRPHGTVRIGAATLFQSAFSAPLLCRTTNGGDAEQFVLDRDCLHTEPASTLVSCRTGFGATDGWIELGDQRRGLRFSWDPAQCAAFPMLYHRTACPDALTRLFFSLSELDETSHPEGSLPGLALTLTPY